MGNQVTKPFRRTIKNDPMFERNNIQLNFANILLSFRADIALIGLAVMGQNLILNMADHGFTVSS